MKIEETKECKKCMYFKEKNFCIRRKKKIENYDSCLHFVKETDRHSLELLLDSIIDGFL